MFEKEAEEYYESKPVHTYVDSLGFFHDLEGIKQAYIQGRIDERKANEWHYVKDGDLPKDRHNVYVAYMNGYYQLVYTIASFRHKYWIINGLKTECEIIAWCELPKWEIKEK